MKYTVFTSIVLIALNTLTEGMDYRTSAHTKKQHNNKVSKYEKNRQFNVCNPFIGLTRHKFFYNFIAYYYIENSNPTYRLLDSIKNFLTLSRVSKHFNMVLTLRTIGTFFKYYTVIDKNETLNYITLFNHKEQYALNRLMMSILIYAGADITKKISFPSHEITQSPLVTAIAHNDARLVRLVLKHKANPNEMVLHQPTLFYARTPKIAQMLLCSGADLRAINASGNNILWHIVSNAGISLSATLLPFYIEKGIDIKKIREKDNACIFHHLAYQSYSLVHDHKNFLKKSKVLLALIPQMINTLNKNNKTPLDLVLAYRQSRPSYLIGKLITLFRDHGGKSADALGECIICFEIKEYMMNIPCSNVHNERICLNCYSDRLQKSDMCLLCHNMLKK
jgi:hypothetical protein